MMIIRRKSDSKTLSTPQSLFASPRRQMADMLREFGGTVDDYETVVLTEAERNNMVNSESIDYKTDGLEVKTKPIKKLSNAETVEVLNRQLENIQRRLKHFALVGDSSSTDYNNTITLKNSIISRIQTYE